MSNNNNKYEEKASMAGQSNKPLSLPAHALKYEVVRQELDANLRDGLTNAESKARLEQYGRNELNDGPGVQPFKILIRQVANAMMLVSFPISPQAQSKYSNSSSA